MLNSAPRFAHQRHRGLKSIPMPAEGQDRTSSLPNTDPILRILATTDLHAHLLSYDYLTNRPQFGIGLAQASALIAQARAEVGASVLLDNGDFLQGSPLADLAASRLARQPGGREHPAIAAFNLMEYDAVALGNHEFNFGLDVLQNALMAARFPALSANIAWELGATPLQDRLLVRPYTLIRRELMVDGAPRPVTLGVLGLTPPEVLHWDRRFLEGRVLARPMVEAARAWLPVMRSAGADLVVCLAHTGLPCAGRVEFGDGLAIEIAALPGVDAVVAGHSHQVFPQSLMTHADPRVDTILGQILGKPVVQPGHSASHVGVIDLHLRPGKGTGWHVTGSRSRVLSTSETVAGLSQAEIRDTTAPLRNALSVEHRSTLSRMREVIGTSAVPLSTHFATVVDGQALRLIAAAKIAYAQERLVGTSAAALPVIAVVAPFRAGGRGGPLNYTDIEAGALSYRNVLDLYSFPNTLVAEIATGDDLRMRLEEASAIFHTLLPGLANQPLINVGIPSFRFTTAPGLGFTIDLSRAPHIGAGAADSGRITDLTYAGRLVRAEDRFVLVTNNHLADQVRCPRRMVVLDDQPRNADILAAYIRQLGHLRAPFAGVRPEGWRLRPMPGTSVLFDTGLGALRHLSEVAHLRPELLGVTPAGFHRFRLHL